MKHELRIQREVVRQAERVGIIFIELSKLLTLRREKDAYISMKSHSMNNLQM